jgi:hypothetical protein
VFKILFNHVQGLGLIGGFATPWTKEMSSFLRGLGVAGGTDRSVFYVSCLTGTIDHLQSLLIIVLLTVISLLPLLFVSLFRWLSSICKKGQGSGAALSSAYRSLEDVTADAPASPAPAQASASSPASPAPAQIRSAQEEQKAGAAAAAVAVAAPVKKQQTPTTSDACTDLVWMYYVRAALVVVVTLFPMLSKYARHMCPLLHHRCSDSLSVRRCVTDKCSPLCNRVCYWTNNTIWSRI